MNEQSEHAHFTFLYMKVHNSLQLAQVILAQIIPKIQFNSSNYIEGGI